MRIPILLQILLALLVASAQTRSTAIRRDGSYLERYIPFVKQEPTTNYLDEFVVHVLLNGHSREMTLDTGSTGILASPQTAGFKDVAEVESRCHNALDCTPAYEYLISSGKYFKGYHILSDLVFTSSTGQTLISKIPVIVTTETGDCTGLNQGCVAEKEVPSTISYLGIGFGRLSDQQPNGTVEYNAFLNVDLGQDLHQGYILSSSGVTLGVQPSDYAEFSYANLPFSPYANFSSGHRREWGQIPMSVEVNGKGPFKGSGLLDAGINYTFLTVPDSATSGFSHGTEPILLDDDVEITVRLGAEDELTSYSYEVGNFDKIPQLTPQEVRLLNYSSGESWFINTGRNFYNGFDVLFDQDCGIVGIRKAPE